MGILPSELNRATAVVSPRMYVSSRRIPFTGREGASRPVEMIGVCDAPRPFSLLGKSCLGGEAVIKSIGTAGEW
jgi:hypothetical protein